MRNRLTIPEWNVVQRLSSKAKTDWFWLDTDEDGKDYVKDLEENKIYSLAKGILLLDECLTDLDDYGLTQAEIKTYNDLIIKAKTGLLGKKEIKKGN